MRGRLEALDARDHRQAAGWPLAVAQRGAILGRHGDRAHLAAARRRDRLLKRRDPGVGLHRHREGLLRGSAANASNMLLIIMVCCLISCVYVEVTVYSCLNVYVESIC